MQNILLIIDPFLREPSNEAINVISELHAELQRKNNSMNSYIEVFFPSHSKMTLKDYMQDTHARGKQVVGVFSLGSYANITENLEWVNLLGRDLKECIIEKNIPFLGICFSHQLFASLYGATVDFVPDRENIPGKKYNEFRKISILHPRIKLIQDNTNEFISKAKHEQEVKNIPEELELTCTSEHCKVEGLAHKKYPAFSIQSHPEEFHESRGGWDFVKKFISFFISETKLKITTDGHR